MNGENDRARFYTIVSLIAVIAVVLGMILGAVAGGIAGYAVASRRAEQIAQAEVEKELRRIPTPRSEPPTVPTPEFRWPDWPGLPDLRDLPFFSRQGETTGAWITNVVKGSPADKAGLRVGDLITAVNDDKVDEKTSLSDLIGQHKPGDEVEIHYKRGRQDRTVTVTLGESPDQPGKAYLGVTYRDFPFRQ